jgi:hypothetical protein
MTEAAARGLFTSADSDPRDRLFWPRVAFVCDELERQRQEKRVAYAMFRTLAVLVRASNDGLESVFSALDQITTIQGSLLFPYLEPEDKQKAAKDLADLWKEVYGDPNDPAVQAEIAKMVAYLDGSS